jgi:hypothetical protein
MRRPHNGGAGWRRRQVRAHFRHRRRRDFDGQLGGANAHRPTDPEHDLGFDPLAVDERPVRRPKIADFDPAAVGGTHSRVAARKLWIVDRDVGVLSTDDQFAVDGKGPLRPLTCDHS